MLYWISKNIPVNAFIEKTEMMSEILNLLFDEQFYFSTEVKPIKEEIDYDKIYEEIKKRFRDEKYRTGGRSDIF